jgi:hypothetical protein
MFKIETNTDHGWTDDPSILGHGCTDKDNRWPTEAAALAACDELASYAGFDRSKLRVVPMPSQLRQAYYSPSAAKLYGSSIYRGADGSEIEVTCVEPSLESTGIYKWQDQVPVGPVIEWIRKGQTGSNPLPRLQ